MLESVWNWMVKRATEPSQLERVELAIWDLRHSSRDPTIPEIIKASRLAPSTVYHCIERLERIRKVKRVKDENGQSRIVSEGSPLMGSESERLIYGKLCSGDPEVESLALKELDELSRGDRIRSDNLLGYITNEARLKSALNFRILTRQVTLTKKDDDHVTLYRLGLRVGYAEKVARKTSEDQYFRDEAFLYLKIIKPEMAVKVGLKMIELDERDEALDSTEPTQLWIDLSTTLATAAQTQPSTRQQLYSLIEEKRGIGAVRAGKILKTALNPPQDTTPGMFGNVPPKPFPGTGSKSSVKQPKNGTPIQHGTSPNITEQARTNSNMP